MFINYYSSLMCGEVGKVACSKTIHVLGTFFAHLLSSILDDSETETLLLSNQEHHIFHLASQNNSPIISLDDHWFVRSNGSLRKGPSIVKFLHFSTILSDGIYI